MRRFVRVPDSARTLISSFEDDSGLEVGEQLTLKIVHDGQAASPRPAEQVCPKDPDILTQILECGVLQGDAAMLLGKFPLGGVDLFFTSPPYADARAYSRIHPDRYVEWFLPFARSMFDAMETSGSLIVNIKNRVANRRPLKGQRHPYVYQLVLALQTMGWRWVETYIWAKPNGVPGKFGPRTKDSFEYVYQFARTNKPYFDLGSIRVPYKADAAEIARRKLDPSGAAIPRPVLAETVPRLTCSVGPTPATW